MEVGVLERWIPTSVGMIRHRRTGSPGGWGEGREGMTGVGGSYRIRRLVSVG